MSQIVFTEATWLRQVACRPTWLGLAAVAAHVAQHLGHMLLALRLLQLAHCQGQVSEAHVIT